MVATAERRITHRPETIREANQRIELAERRRDAGEFCDRMEQRLGRLYVAAVEIGPAAEQHVAGAIHEVRRYRVRAA